MPRVNLYIRKEDEERWASLENKSEFIHNALNEAPYGEPKSVDWGKAQELPVSTKPFKTKPAFRGTRTDRGEHMPPIDKNWSGPIYRNKKKSKL